MFFKRVIIALFGFFICLMLFVFIIRIANNKSGFLGISDLFDYFDSGLIDFKKPIDDFVASITKCFTGFSSIIEKAKNIHSFFDVLSILGKGLMQGLQLIAFPVILIFDLIKLIIDYFSIFFSFINWLISFEGWLPSVS